MSSNDHQRHGRDAERQMSADPESKSPDSKSRGGSKARLVRR
jgi:hypothetical protein